MRSFHLPLPDSLDAALRAEAAKRQQPATTLAREAIEDWLSRQRKLVLHEAIAAYASAAAETDADLDADLERAAVDHLLAGRQPPARRSPQPTLPRMVAPRDGSRKYRK